MSLIVEDGTAKTDAESYASDAEATSYATNFNKTWNKALNEREACLRQATQYIDATYGELFKGVRVKRTQSLEWPRFDADDGDYDIDSNVVPQKIKDITIELAMRALSTDLAPDVTKSGEIIEETDKIGPLTFTKKWSDGNGSDGLTNYTLIDRMILPYIHSGSQFTVAG